MREYATIEEENNDYVFVKTAKGDQYKIDRQYIDYIEPGTLVLVVYEPDNKVKDGDYYYVLPTRIERSSTEVQTPGKKGAHS